MTEGKLFVGQVPAVCTEQMLTPLFMPYGEVLEIKIMRDQAGRSKGCAWVRYATQEAAQDAIDSLHEKHTIPPQTNMLQVRYAHSSSNRSREERKDKPGGVNEEQLAAGYNNAFQLQQQAQQQAWGAGGMNPAAAQQMGGNPMYYNPAMWWYGNQGGAQPDGAGLGVAGGFQQGVPQAGQQQRAYRKPKNPHSSELHGTANVFVGNLSRQATEEDLYNLFSPMGGFVSATIHRERDGTPRGFGFVDFDNAKSAQAAVDNLNGVALLGKPMRVERTYRTKEVRDQEEAALALEREQQMQQMQAGEQQPAEGYEHAPAPAMEEVPAPEQDASAQPPVPEAAE